MKKLQNSESVIVAGGNTQESEQNTEKVKVAIPTCIDEDDIYWHKMSDKFHDKVEYHRCNWP